MLLSTFGKYIHGLIFIFLSSACGFSQADQTLYEGSTCTFANGDSGICKELTACSSIYNEIKKTNSVPNDLIHCSFKGSSEVICCPSPKDQSTLPTRFGETLPGAKAKEACGKYVEFVGKGLTFHILNGIAAEEGEFPHMVALGYRDTISDQLTWDCGGSLISDRYVLTAAHCLVLNNRPLSVMKLGTTSLAAGFDEYAQEVYAENIIFHPEYKYPSTYNDLALIRLNKSLEFNKDIYPACLYTNVSDVDSTVELFATGWGTMNLETKKKSDILLKVNLTSEPLTECNASLVNYGLNRRYPQGITEGQLCALDPASKGDTCNGDSGGPLQIVSENGVSTVVGIVSFGINCASSISGIYVRVAHYINWIESIVWPIE